MLKSTSELKEPKGKRPRTIKEKPTIWTLIGLDEDSTENVLAQFDHEPSQDTIANYAGETLDRHFDRLIVVKCELPWYHQRS